MFVPPVLCEDELLSFGESDAEAARAAGGERGVSYLTVTVTVLLGESAEVRYSTLGEQWQNYSKRKFSCHFAEAQFAYDVPHAP
jgi:hypothetical protein